MQKKIKLFEEIYWTRILMISVLMILLCRFYLTVVALGGVLNGGGGSLTGGFIIILLITLFFVIVFCRKAMLKNISVFLTLHIIIFIILFLFSQFYYRDSNYITFSNISPFYVLADMEYSIVKDNPMGKIIEKKLNKNYQTEFNYYTENIEDDTLMLSFKPIEVMTNKFKNYPEYQVGYSINYVCASILNTEKCFGSMETQIKKGTANYSLSNNYKGEEFEIEIKKEDLTQQENDISINITIKGENHTNERKTITITNKNPIIIKNDDSLKTNKQVFNESFQDKINNNKDILDKYVLKDLLDFTDYTIIDMLIDSGDSYFNKSFPRYNINIKVDSSFSESDDYYRKLFSNKNKWISKRIEDDQYINYHFYTTDQFNEISDVNNQWQLDGTLDWKWVKSHLKTNKPNWGNSVSINKMENEIYLIRSVY